MQLEQLAYYFSDLVYTIFLADGNVVTLRNNYLLKLLTSFTAAFQSLLGLAVMVVHAS